MVIYSLECLKWSREESSQATAVEDTRWKAVIFTATIGSKRHSAFYLFIIFPRKKGCFQPIRMHMCLTQAAVSFGWNLVRCCCCIIYRLRLVTPLCRVTWWHVKICCFFFFKNRSHDFEVASNPSRVWGKPPVLHCCLSADPHTRFHALALPMKTSRGRTQRT